MQAPLFLHARGTRSSNGGVHMEWTVGDAEVKMGSGPTRSYYGMMCGVHVYTRYAGR